MLFRVVLVVPPRLSQQINEHANPFAVFRTLEKMFTNEQGRAAPLDALIFASCDQPATVEFRFFLDIPHR